MISYTGRVLTAERSTNITLLSLSSSNPNPTSLDSNSKMGTGHNTFNSELIDSTHLQAAEGGDGVFKNVDVTSKRTATTTLENPFELL